MKVNKIDIATMKPGQKIFAGFLLLVSIYFLNLILPTVNEVIKMGWKALFYGVPLLGIVLYVALNPTVVWNWYLSLSFRVTRKIVEKNKEFFAYRYYNYMLQKATKVKEARMNLSSIKKISLNEAQKLKETIENNVRSALNLENRLGKDHSEVKLLNHKVNIDTKMLKALGPKLVSIENKEKILIQFEDKLSTDAEMVKYEIDSVLKEHEINKEMSNAADQANSVMDINSDERRLFDVAMSQIETETSRYLANIEEFERVQLPKLAAGNATRELSEEEGAKLIESFKQNTLAFKRTEDGNQN